MHTVGNYIFDPSRLIVYESGQSRDTVDLINSYFEVNDSYEEGGVELCSHNSADMCMNRIAINSIGICLTYNCNLRCTYCAYSSTNSDKNVLRFEDVKLFVTDIIKKRTIKKLISKQNDYLDVYFTGGGEPTFDWKLFVDSVTFIRHQCEEKSIPLRLGLTTNGVLSDTQIQFIGNNFNNVMISYDGLPEIQNKNRKTAMGKDTNLIVEQTIRKIAEYNIPLTIRTTVWKSDFVKLRDMYRHIFSIVPKNAQVVWSIYPTLYDGRALEQVRDQEQMNFKNFLLNYIDLIEDVISNEGYEKTKKIDAAIYNITLSKIFCGAHRVNRPWLLPDGSIVTCIESKEFKTYVGQVQDGELSYFQKYSDRLLETVQNKFFECKNCIAYPFCKGGCPIWHLRVSNQGIEAPECGIQKELWNYIIDAALSGRYSFGWHLRKMDVPNLTETEVYKLVNYHQ